MKQPWGGTQDSSRCHCLHLPHPPPHPPPHLPSRATGQALHQSAPPRGNWAGTRGTATWMTTSTWQRWADCLPLSCKYRCSETVVVACLNMYLLKECIMKTFHQVPVEKYLHCYITKVFLKFDTHNAHWFKGKPFIWLVYISISVGHLFVGSMLFEAMHRQDFSEVLHWTRGCHARFCWLHSVLLIATDLWKLGNCTAERLLSSPAFPHSHFQRFQRFWSIDWWWRIAEARGSTVKALSLSRSLVWMSQSWDSCHCYLLQRQIRCLVERFSFACMLKLNNISSCRIVVIAYTVRFLCNDEIINSANIKISLIMLACSSVIFLWPTCQSRLPWGGTMQYKFRCSGYTYIYRYTYILNTLD